MRIAIATLGCKANQYDSEVLRAKFESRGCHVVSFSENADIYVINTCTVTGKTDYQSRQLVRRAHRRNPQAKIVVTGCYAHVAPGELALLPGVSIIAGNLEKKALAELVLEATNDKEPLTVVTPFQKNTPFFQEPIEAFAAKTRFFLKIQDGCNARCTYCIIPQARGPSRSMDPETVLQMLRNIGRADCKEVVLTGIHLGAYGFDLDPATSLLQLLRQIEELKPVSRIRLSSLEPNELTQELIDFLAKSNTVCPHLHLPLQSGNNAVLHRMNRPYSAEEFRRLVENAVDSIPELAVGVDVMVGFPGEDNHEFQETFNLLEALPITYFHVFPFSPRKGTPASLFPEKVHGTTVKLRKNMLHSLSRQKKACFYKSYLGKNVPVLIEATRDRRTNLLKGFSRNYIPVQA
ncbi:MAG: tRNA (N(6)-L-threonylcarbamoyladenosine(37)-C(2))-methylthiotransferase MtaB, partial [Deltaproteobacteria bacterium]|nr:tRNA (N(6)-L-threonylcarbamoyladenosine(37)-C(2))-methylthiotransferase MtaB [Deltaproteobacteria bacterium]